MTETCSIVDRKTRKGTCPLQNVEVKALIGEELAEVTVRHSYANTGPGSIEALYTFPLPHRAQITGFKAKIGDSEVTGEIREKEEAFKEYDDAVRKGDSAFLLESHRPDIFQVSLGNLAAGERAVATISYLQEVETADHELRWTLPTVVAPRYIPGKKTGRITGPGIAAPTDRVPDADYITPPPGESSYTLKVEAVFANLPIGKVSSPSHPVQVSMEKDRIVVTLARENELLDSDFLVVASLEEETGSMLTAAKHEELGSFALLKIVPELVDMPSISGNHEYTFMVDVSGSMAGTKLDQAKRALRIALRNLMEGDRFNIIAFESDFRCFSKETVCYSQENLEKADLWVDALTDMGGTEIFKPLEFVLRGGNLPEGSSRIILLFTDGQVGNEKEIIRLVHHHRRSLCFFPFGIDTAVNRYFIDSLAEAGNGMPEYIFPGERLEDKVIRQFARIHQPYVSHPAIMGKDGMELETVPGLPARLYSDESYRFMIRTNDPDRLDHVTLRGQLNQEEFRQELGSVYPGDSKLLALKWAKEKIIMLENQLGTGNNRRNEAIGKEILHLSLGFGLLSTVTSFVAVHKRIVKETGIPETVVVPVCPPRDWRISEPAPVLYSMAPPAEMTRSARMDENATVSINRTYGTRKNKALHTEGMRAIHFMEEGLPENCEPEAPGVMDELNEAMRMAAQRQNADGTFGKGKNVNKKTSFFIIGMLSHKEAWKTYRIQVVKAGAALLKTGAEDALLKALALFMIQNSKVGSGKDMKALKNMKTAVENIADSFTEQEHLLFEELRAGGLQKLLAFVTGREPDRDAGRESGYAREREGEREEIRKASIALLKQAAD